MSAQSGIRVPPELAAAFATATSNAESTRALVFTIEGGESGLPRAGAPSSFLSSAYGLVGPHAAVEVDFMIAA